MQPEPPARVHREIRAVGEKYTYSMSGKMRVPNEFRKDFELLGILAKTRVEEVIRKLSPRYRDMVARGQVAAADAWHEQTHEAMEQFAKEFGLTYKRTLTNDANFGRFINRISAIFRRVFALSALDARP